MLQARLAARSDNAPTVTKRIAWVITLASNGLPGTARDEDEVASRFAVVLRVAAESIGASWLATDCFFSTARLVFGIEHSRFQLD